jgi:rhodanese-related sulfurtransferase
MGDFTEFAMQNWLLFMALFVILGLLVGGEVLRKVRGISTLDAVGALRLINDREAVIVDVREIGDYRGGHIPQARHIPLSALQDRAGELANKDKPILVYCRSGSVAQSACALLKKQGLTDVHSLKGGLLAWTDAQLPVSRNDKKA